MTREPVQITVVGGGVIGLSAAWDLARAGHRVTVIDAGPERPMAAACSAGIVGAEIDTHGPPDLREMGVKSRARYPQWVAALEASSGVAVGLRMDGTLRVRERASGEAAPPATRRAAELEPALAARWEVVDHFPHDGHLDAVRLMTALRLASLSAGVSMRQARVDAIHAQAAGGWQLEVSDALGANALVHSEKLLLCAGAWTATIAGSGIATSALGPVRGQALELQGPVGLLRHVVFGDACYLSPRDDGRVIVGATMDHVGFDDSVVEADIERLHAAAVALCPALASAPRLRCWAGLRPWTPDLRPIVSSDPTRPGLAVLTGHFRAGILMAPLAGEQARALLALDPEPALSC